MSYKGSFARGGSHSSASSNAITGQSCSLSRINPTTTSCKSGIHSSQTSDGRLNSYPLSGKNTNQSYSRIGSASYGSLNSYPGSGNQSYSRSRISPPEPSIESWAERKEVSWDGWSASGINDRKSTTSQIFITDVKKATSPSGGGSTTVSLRPEIRRRDNDLVVPWARQPSRRALG